jgi:predicted RNA binding protein YcfA (HicA-like mRNA interferase family)
MADQEEVGQPEGAEPSSAPIEEWPSLPAGRLLAILRRKPLEYRVQRQKGSHRTLVSRNGYPNLGFSFHDNATIPRGLVREILVDRVGLDNETARNLV